MFLVTAEARKAAMQGVVKHPDPDAVEEAAERELAEREARLDAARVRHEARHPGADVPPDFEGIAAESYNTESYSPRVRARKYDGQECAAAQSGRCI